MIGQYCIIYSKMGHGYHVRSHSIIYEDCTIGENFHCGHHVLIREDCQIGNNVSIGSFCDIEDGVIIGDDVRIHSRCFLPCHTIIEAGAWVGPNVVFTNDKYPNTDGQREGVLVRPGAVIGAGAILLPGIHVGDRAMVGAGSVVTKSVPPGALVVGNPARIVRWLSETP